MEQEETKAPRKIDVEKTTLKALAIILMFVVSLIGLCYSGWLLWTLPPKK